MTISAVSAKRYNFFAECRQLERDASAKRELSDEEDNVYNGILDGLTDEAIGERFGRNKSWVKNRTLRIFAKFSVRSRAQLFAFLYGRYFPDGG